MTGTGITLVLMSALLHAVWNFFLKGSSDRWAFFFAQSVATMVVYAPALVWRWPHAQIDAAGWWWIVASSLAHGVYAFYLLKAYDVGDLSIAYPLSRTAPLLVVAWDVTTTANHLTVAGVAGAVLAGLGALTLELPALRTRGGRAVLTDRVTRYSLITAVSIAVFTIIDKHGVAHVDPFVFMYLIIVGELPLVALRLGRALRAQVRREVHGNRRAVVFAALISPLSYLLILWVLTTAPASYVLGLRQTSIIFGVLLGRSLLREPESGYRLTGAAIIAAGSALIAAAG
jgi:uncharacterized membrane protein